MATMTSKSTFDLKTDLDIIPLTQRDDVDFSTYLYRSNPVEQNRGRVLVLTQPEQNGGHCVSPGICNGFVGTILRAYNEHRHLVLRPDDVWLAITTAFGLYINSGHRAEEMRRHFVDFEEKKVLAVGAGGGTMTSWNWHEIIDRMSDLIEKNTKKDTRQWLEPDFTTTTPVCKTVGQVVMMGVLKNYFEYVVCGSGLPKVTLEGTLADWEKLREKASHLKSFDVDCLTHWASLLDVVLEKFVESYKGNVDEDFWSKIKRQQGWASGPQSHFTGWVNIFMPFSKTGDYTLNEVKPEKGEWGCTYDYDVPPSTMEVPVKIIDDTGSQYDTIFYGGHIVCVYNPDDNTIRPSLDWAIVDITDNTEPANPGMYRYAEQANDLPKPTKFVYGA